MMFATGAEALRRRDEIEQVLIVRLPRAIRPLASAALSSLTGLAPSGQPEPEWKGSAARAFAYMLGLQAGGLLLMAYGHEFAGSLLLVGGMRAFTSAVGHHMTHGARVLPVTPAVHRLLYDMISAVLTLPSFDEYRRDHQKHHAFVAGAKDPDQQLIASLLGRWRSWGGLASVFGDPRFHARFYRARLRSAITRGPVWRRVVALLSVALQAALSPIWLAMVLGYQVASLASIFTLHLWDRRQEEKSPAEIATAVTFGRLLLPEADFLLLPRLAVYTVVRLLLLQFDLGSHDLHHLGEGPWTETAYVRTRLLLSGSKIRQTLGLRAMCAAALISARTLPPATEGIRDQDYLNM